MTLELQINVLTRASTVIGNYAFSWCFCLRNVAFPPDAVFGDKIFIDEDTFVNEGARNAITDLQQLFGDSDARLISELQHQFDGLPIHRLVYYQSYNQGVLQILVATINMRSSQSRTLRSKLDPTGNQQDCLGMTPLHILACSSVHDPELYHVIVDNYPTNLITEDRWGYCHCFMYFGGLHQLRLSSFFLRAMNHFTLIMYSTGH
jgi:hypothetical protein